MSNQCKLIATQCQIDYLHAHRLRLNANRLPQPSSRRRCRTRWTCTKHTTSCFAFDMWNGCTRTSLQDMCNGCDPRLLTRILKPDLTSSRYRGALAGCASPCRHDLSRHAFYTLEHERRSGWVSVTMMWSWIARQSMEMQPTYGATWPIAAVQDSDPGLCC